MEAALEEIEFLALSANRVKVLDVLAEGTKTRRELAEVTDASQPTIGRILRDFEEREWITRDGDGYRATVTGQFVAKGFTDLLDIVETERKLRDLVKWLPTGTMEFDLRRLRTATITLPSQVRPSAPVRRVTDLIHQSDRVEIVSHAFNEQSLDAIRRETIEGSQTFEGVFSADAIDAIAGDSTLRQRLRELVASERAEIRICDEDVPLAVTITDDVVHLLLRDEDGVLQAALDTDDPEVLSWARESHERYWGRSAPLDADALE